MTQHRKIILVVIIALILAALYMTMRQNGSSSTPQTNSSSTTSTSSEAKKAPLTSAPNRDILSNTLDGSDVTTFMITLQAAGLADMLQGKDAYTVFAPSNEAFTKLEDGTLDSLLHVQNKSRLVTLMKNHIVSGRYTSAELTDGQTLKALSGKLLNISKSANGSITINSSTTVTTKDVLASNGVTFVIDSVITTK